MGVNHKTSALLEVVKANEFVPCSSSSTTTTTASPSSVGVAKATCWSWILQYPSETDVDLLIDIVLFMEGICLDGVEEETEEFLLNFGACNDGSFLFDASSSPFSVSEDEGFSFFLYMFLLD